MKSRRNVSPEEFAFYTGMSLPQVFRLIRSGRLPAMRNRVTWRWRIQLPVKLAVLARHEDR